MGELNIRLAVVSSYFASEKYSHQIRTTKLEMSVLTKFVFFTWFEFNISRMNLLTAYNTM